MSLKETLEELIDKYEEDEPFLTVGARAVLATYRKLLQEENKSRLFNSDEPGRSRTSVRRPRSSRRGTK